MGAAGPPGGAPQGGVRASIRLPRRGPGVCRAAPRPRLDPQRADCPQPLAGQSVGPARDPPDPLSPLLRDIFEDDAELSGMSRDAWMLSAF